MAKASKCDICGAFYDIGENKAFGGIRRYRVIDYHGINEYQRAILPGPAPLDLCSKCNYSLYILLRGMWDGAIYWDPDDDISIGKEETNHGTGI